MTTPLDACSPISLNFTPPIGMNLIMLIKRGNCTFKKKTINSEIAGAKIAIIYDNLEEDLFIMRDDGTSGKISSR